MPKQLTVPQQLWVDALRSGSYTQTKYALDKYDGFCCLGVACAVAEEHGVSVIREGSRISGSSLRQQPDVQDWLGLKSTCGEFLSEDGSEHSLMHFNDGMNKTFAEIAYVIEANADKLFKD